MIGISRSSHNPTDLECMQTLKKYKTADFLIETISQNNTNMSSSMNSSLDSINKLFDRADGCSDTIARCAITVTDGCNDNEDDSDNDNGDDSDKDNEDDNYNDNENGDDNGDGIVNGDDNDNDNGDDNGNGYNNIGDYRSNDSDSSVIAIRFTEDDLETMTYATQVLQVQYI